MFIRSLFPFGLLAGNIDNRLGPVTGNLDLLLSRFSGFFGLNLTDTSIKVFYLPLVVLDGKKRGTQVVESALRRINQIRLNVPDALDRFFKIVDSFLNLIPAGDKT